jgi:hypothetical protein
MVVIWNLKRQPGRTRNGNKQRCRDHYGTPKNISVNFTHENLPEIDPSIAGAKALAHIHTLKGPPPCFFFAECHAYSTCYRQGKSVCDACAATLTGQIRPLEDPRALPPYPSQIAAAKAMGMTGVMRYY